jgi:hypothetical protein
MEKEEMKKKKVNENICSGAHLKCDFAFVLDGLYRVDTRHKFLVFQ